MFNTLFDISFSYWRVVIIGLIITLAATFIVWLVCSYYVLKWFKMNIDRDYFYFNEYNADCCNILENYGDYPIKRIYLVRQPITQTMKTLINILTLYKFEREMKKYIKLTNKGGFLVQHTSIIIEVELSDKTRKSILIEKKGISYVL